ncbi:MAG TPA: PQQ-binding-like beta-propeller repeat protein [Polyangiales bacterium]|nr:PQQ-binding-like beta-propeller repeat protein [Polyangiales bacterium]
MSVGTAGTPPLPAAGQTQGASGAAAAAPPAAAGGAGGTTVPPVTAGQGSGGTPVPAGSGGGPAPAAGGGTAPPPAGTGGDVVVPPPPPGTSQWTMIGHDAASTYNNSDETVLTKQNAASLTMAWQIDMGTNVYGAPLMVGDKIYASAGTGIRAYDAASGMELWKGAGGGTTGSMAYDAGTLYYYTTSGNIVALDASNGRQKWSKAPMGSPGGDGSSSPIVAGNFILIGGSSGGGEVLGARFRGFLAAFDKTSGAGVWTEFTVPSGSTGASLWSSPAADVAGGRAFGTTGNNHGAPATDSSDSFVAFDLMKGTLLWKNQRTMGDTWGPGSEAPDADFGANPVLYETMIGGVMTKVVASGQKNGAAHALKRDDGMQIWTRKLCEGSRDGSLGIFVNASWSGKYMLYACNGAGNSKLFALDGATGEIGWMTPLPGEVYGRMSVANKVGFVGSGKNLVVFDTDTGMILKVVPSKGGTVAGTISIANGRVAFGEGLTWATGVGGRTLTVLKVQ